MVGSINPNSTQTLDAQIQAAKGADFQVAPGQPVPREASSTLAVAPAASSLGTVAPVSHHSSKLPGTTILGIVLGCLAFLAICVGIFYFVSRKARTKREQAASLALPTHPVSIGPLSPEVSGYLSPISPYNEIPSYHYPGTLFPFSPWEQQYVLTASEASSVIHD
jgi:hypothetical protein